MPLEPLPHAGPEPKSDDEAETTSQPESTEGEVTTMPEDGTPANSVAGAEDDSATVSPTD